MIPLHDKLSAMKPESTTLTERGQVSVPSSIRRALAMKPGQKLLWRRVSDDELRVQVVRPKLSRDAAAAIGWAKKHHQARGWPTRTNAWLRRLRRGETKG